MLFWNNVVLPSLIGWIGKMRQPLNGIVFKQEDESKLCVEKFMWHWWVARLCLFMWEYLRVMQMK